MSGVGLFALGVIRLAVRPALKKVRKVPSLVAKVVEKVIEAHKAREARKNGEAPASPKDSPKNNKEPPPAEDASTSATRETLKKVAF